MIRGPNISMRLIRNDEDEHLFQCLKDWPPDAHGPFTRDRAAKTLANAMKEHRLIEYPLQEGSDWFVTLVIEHQGQAVGITKARIWHTSVWVEWLALLPTTRGQGLFREIRLAWSALTFEVLQAEKIGFATRTDIAATLDIIDRYSGDTSDGVRKLRHDTDSEKLKWWHTRENHLADRDEGMRDREGNRITFEAT